MKTKLYMSLSILLLSVSLATSAEEPAGTPLTSKIESVTVYLDQASVSRTAAAKLSAGSQRLVFAGLPDDLDDQSLRLSLSGNARIDGLSARKTFLSQHGEETVRKLESEAEALEDQMKEQQDLLAILEKAQALLDSIQVARTEKLSRDLGREDGKGPSVEDYRAVLGFAREEKIGNAAKIRQYKAAIRKLEPVLNAKKKELAEVKGRATLEQKEVVVLLSSEKPGEVRLDLSYMVPGALWYPVYDLRSDTQRGVVELTYHAMVQQATGEDWGNATLLLAATRPATQVEPPRPTPWYLSLETLVHNLQSQQAEGVAAAWNPWENLNRQFAARSVAQKVAHQQLLTAGNQSSILRMAASVEKRSTSAILPLPARESIPSDGKPRRVTLGTWLMPAVLQYMAVPKQSRNTYVVGQVENASSLPILPGTANVFVGQDLIGSATTDFIAPREIAEFYLGVEEGIKVTRILDEKNSARSFFGDQKRLEVAYTLTVENLLKTASEVLVQEALPVSQDERIRSAVRATSPEPQGNDRGIARWKIRLEPGESRTVQFAYTIEYPSDLTLAELAPFEGQLKLKR